MLPPLICTVILVAAAILKATGHLSDWWGIALVVALGTIVWLRPDLREPPAGVTTDGIVPGVVLGVFCGAALVDAWWGTIIGGILMGFLFSFPDIAGPE